jgi:ankyrin repeat protein
MMGHAGICGLLLQHGADVNAVGARGATPLMAGAVAGDESVTSMLAKRAELDQRGKFGCTALILAASEGKAGIVKILLTEGASVEAADDAGNTALLHAAARGHLPVMRLLLEKGAAADVALPAAEANGQQEALQLLRAYVAEAAATNGEARDLVQKPALS